MKDEQVMMLVRSALYSIHLSDKTSHAGESTIVLKFVGLAFPSVTVDEIWECPQTFPYVTLDFFLFFIYTGEPISLYVIGKDARHNQVLISQNDHL